MKHLLFLFLIITLTYAVIFFASNAAVVPTSIEVRLAECSDDVDNDGDFLIDYPNDPQCSSDIDDDENVGGTETHATTTLTAASGGSHSHTNAHGLNTDFNFPADFYSTNIRLFINTYANNFFASTKPALSGKSFVGKTYDFDIYTATGTQVSVLDKEVSITLRYRTEDVSGLDESTLAPYRWGSGDSSWQLIAGSTLDTTNNQITFSTASFSSFAIFGSPPTPPSEEPAPSGGGGGISDRILRILYELRAERAAEEAVPVKVLRLADFNNDGGVNITDLSILLYFFDKPMPLASRYDLNDDGKIDIVDISILLYYWA